MAETTQLEDIFDITEGSYTTGSEYLDGLLIGLATLLLIRNGEFVLLDILTLIFGDRRQRIGFRVLRTWQMLNVKHFYDLITGFDSDIPKSLLRRVHWEKRFRSFTGSRCKIKKGRFASKLFLCVLLGKVLILGLEVAIIALVIPVAKVHRSEGGLGFRWKNATISQASLRNSHPFCQPLLSSKRLTENAQITLCKRGDLGNSYQESESWIENGSLRMEEIILTPDTVKQAGGVAKIFTTPEGGTEKKVFCAEQNASEASSSVRLHSDHSSRQTDNASQSPNAEFRNNVRVGEIEISGYSIRTKVGTFEKGSAAMLPIFNEAEVQEAQRITFSDFYSRMGLRIEGNGPTVNGKLLFGAEQNHSGVFSRTICLQAINEVVRVTGTLHPELLIDLFRMSMTVEARMSFYLPSTNSFSYGSGGFEIGRSRKFRIPPEWMILAATLVVLLSWITSHWNRTEEHMARVYREHNNMWCACSPVFLEEDNVVAGLLFQRENEYHWGESPGEEWETVLASPEFSKDAMFV